MVPEGNRSTSSSSEQVPLSASQHESRCDADATSPSPGSCGADRVVRSQRPQRRGPRTKAGKARVACNALTHGLTSARLVVPGERPEDWAAHCRDVLEALAPIGPVERALAERVASAAWRLRRVIAHEVVSFRKLLRSTPLHFKAFSRLRLMTSRASRTLTSAVTLNGRGLTRYREYM